ncbi:hypothetical protein Droror1_Dr00006962 [Drosera rotundifolia]
MNIKRSSTISGNKTMRIGGFMCHSPASTAVCVPSDVRSMIVPRGGVDHRGLIDAPRYSRLVESRLRPGPRSSRSRRSGYAPSGERPNEMVQQTKPQQIQLALPSSDVVQVVVLRVSIHCQACAGKLKKHLSKMEGVTSYSIELELKRVTVVGQVSAAGVLESVSKIKRAELWA